ECARLQTFPEEWQFAGNRAAQYRQIGNAVAPEMGRLLGQVIDDMLKQPKPAEGDFDPAQLPVHLESHVRYTRKEHERNGASRKAAPNRRRTRQAWSPK
ncbi:MAG: DNA cytosine methyltransferase, partial [Phycisphaeraceae bacterium]